VTITAEPATKTGPANAETDPITGSRWYIHPVTGERFISVTTVLGYISKFGLPTWSGRLAAESAFDRLPWLIRCSRNAPCNSSKTGDACGQCRDCAVLWLSTRHEQVRDDAGDRGRRIHAAAEQLELFGEGFHVDDDIAPYVAQYRRWRSLYRPRFEAAEMTVISRKWGYAGTLDGILRFPANSPLPKSLKHLAGLPVVDDIKSGKHLAHPEGWQVNAYAAADVVLLPDGSELPMPDIEGGLILHVRPDKVQMREVHLNPENHANFVHMLRAVEGLIAPLGTVLSRPVNLPKES
jgi:hypothetical protein